MNCLKNLIYGGVLFVVFGLGTSVYGHEEHGDIIISDAWVRVMPPMQKNTAAYMTIENKTDKEVVLSSATTDVAKEVQLHKMEHVDGMMKMQRVNNISIPAQGQAMLKPGGLHLMLMGLVKPVKDEDPISITLKFSNGLTKIVNLTAKENGLKGHMHHE